MKAGMSPGEAEATYKAAVATEMAFIMNYAGTKTEMLTGKVIATVYSGHPSRTTFGNSIRVMSLFRTVQRRCGIPDTAFVPFVAGDDGLVVISGRFVRQFLRELARITTTGQV